MKPRPKSKAPPTFKLVPPDVFKDNWHERPTDPIAVGIRRISDKEVSLARSNAARSAWNLHRATDDEANRILAFQNLLLRELIAASVCDPNDVTRPGALDVDALTTEGVKYVWDLIDVFHASTSPCNREASFDELDALADMAPLAADLTGAQGRRIRRLLAICFDELMAHAKTLAPTG